MLVGGGGGGGAGSFDVRVRSLRTASGQVDADATHVAARVDQSAGAALTAGGACGGPLLAAALARLATALRGDGGDLHEAVGAAGSRLSTNADRYTDDDGAAVTGLSGTFSGFGGTSGWGGW